MLQRLDTAQEELALPHRPEIGGGATAPASHLASSLRVASTTQPQQQTSSDVHGTVASYTPTGKSAVLGTQKPTIDTSVARKATTAATTAKAAASVEAYNQQGQRVVVSGTATGVYIGFNVAGLEKKDVPHEYVEVVQNGRARVFEYGPSNSAFLGGEGQQIVEMRDTYHDSDANAGALFRVNAPSGVSETELEDRTLALGNALDSVLSVLPRPYDVTCQLGPNCYGAADAILLNDGVSIGNLLAAGAEAAGKAPSDLQKALGDAAAVTPTGVGGLNQTAQLVVETAVASGWNVDLRGGDSVEKMNPDGSGGWVPASPTLSGGSSPEQVAFEQGMQQQQDDTGTTSLIGTTLSTILGFTGQQIDFSKAPSSTKQLQITLQQISQIMGALEDAIHGGDVNADLLKIATALEARDPQGKLNMESALKVYRDFQEIGKGPQQTIDGVLSLGRDIVSWGHANPNDLTGDAATLYKGLTRAETIIDTGFKAVGDINNILHGSDPVASAQQLGVDLHLSGPLAKDYYDVLQGISALQEIGRGGFVNTVDGSIKLGESILPSSSGFGKWLNEHGQDVLGAVAAFEQIIGGRGVLNQAQGAIDLGEELVKLNVVDKSSALGQWLTKNGAKFTGIIGGIASVIQGWEEGGIQGGIQSGVGVDILLTSIGASGGLATPVAIVIGIVTAIFGGHHDNPQNMPDKYDTDHYGQGVADLQRTMGANGSNFYEDGALSQLFGGRTGIQAVEETLAYYGTKDNAPGWLKPMWDQLAAMFGISAQGSGHLSIGDGGSGKNCNNQQIVGVAGTDGKVYQYYELSDALYAFAAGLAQATDGQGLAADSGYTGAYPTIDGLNWHAVRTGTGFGFYAEDDANPGTFYSYDPSNNNLYTNTNAGVIGGTWVGDVRTYDFTNHKAIVGNAPATPTYGNVAWNGFSLPGGEIAYWGAVQTKTTETIDPTDPGDGTIGRGVKPRPPRTITVTTTTYYYFGADGVLYTGNGPGSLAKGTRVGYASTYDFTKGGVQNTPPAAPKPAPQPPAPQPPAPPVKPPVAPPPITQPPVTPPITVRPPVRPTPLPIRQPISRFSHYA